MNQYLKADLIPDEFSAEGVVRAFTQGNITGARILIPRAQKARDVLEQGLRALQNDVLAVPVYKTVVPSALHQTEQFETVQNCDCIVFTSSSTVHNFFEYSTPAVLQELEGHGNRLHRAHHRRGIAQAWIQRRDSSGEI